MGNINPFHGINLSSVLAGNPLATLTVDSGGAAQFVGIGGHVLVTDVIIMARGTAVICINNESIILSVSKL